jgi:hypothetical protein
MKTLTNVICNTSLQTSSGTATFGSNLRAETLDCTICRKYFSFELAFAFAALVADNFEQRKIVVGQNIMTKRALMMEIYFCSGCGCGCGCVRKRK